MTSHIYLYGFSSQTAAFFAAAEEGVTRRFLDRLS
jgi:hypothetical protein